MVLEWALGYLHPHLGGGGNTGQGVQEGKPVTKKMKQ